MSSRSFPSQKAGIYSFWIPTYISKKLIMFLHFSKVLCPMMCTLLLFNKVWTLEETFGRGNKIPRVLWKVRGSTSLKKVCIEWGTKSLWFWLDLMLEFWWPKPLFYLGPVSLTLEMLWMGWGSQSFQVIWSEFQSIPSHEERNFVGGCSVYDNHCSWASHWFFFCLHHFDIQTQFGGKKWWPSSFQAFPVSLRATKQDLN